MNRNELIEKIAQTVFETYVTLPVVFAEIPSNYAASIDHSGKNRIPFINEEDLSDCLDAVQLYGTEDSEISLSYAKRELGAKDIYEYSQVPGEDGYKPAMRRSTAYALYDLAFDQLFINGGENCINGYVYDNFPKIMGHLISLVPNRREAIKSLFALKKPDRAYDFAEILMASIGAEEESKKILKKNYEKYKKMSNTLFKQLNKFNAEKDGDK